MFEKGVQVRHLDGDSMNNAKKNIAIGTASENMLDRSKYDRAAHAIMASCKIRKFDDEQMFHIKELHANGWGYKKLMERFNISSKGTLHHILNNKYITSRIAREALIPQTNLRANRTLGKDPT